MTYIRTSAVNDHLGRTVVYRHDGVWKQIDSTTKVGALVYEGSAYWVFDDAEAFSVPVERAKRVLEILNGEGKT